MNLIKLLILMIILYCIYTSKNITNKHVILGLIILAYFFFFSKEGFVLSTSVILDPNTLDNDKMYVIGAIDPTKQVKTTTPSINGGADCLSFPTTTYKLAAIKDAICSVSNGTTQSGIVAVNVDGNYIFPEAGKKGYEIKFGPGTCVSDADLGVAGSGVCKVTNNINTTLKSPNGAFKLVLQDDAHLILYDSTNKDIWRTGVFNPPNSVGPFRLELQKEDGNLVIYDSRGRTRPIWGSGRTSASTNGPFRLSVEDNSNVVVYDKNNAVLWARI